jgi:hypothetical protein
MRPTLLIVEPELGESLSTRKLVLESAKFNVLTAHSEREFLEILHAFPKVSAAVVHSLIHEGWADGMLEEAKKINAGIYTILLSPHIDVKSSHADRVIDSHDPETLLQAARDRLGDPRIQDGNGQLNSR